MEKTNVMEQSQPEWVDVLRDPSGLCSILAGLIVGTIAFFNNSKLSLPVSGLIAILVGTSVVLAWIDYRIYRLPQPILNILYLLILLFSFDGLFTGSITTSSFLQSGLFSVLTFVGLTLWAAQFKKMAFGDVQYSFITCFIFGLINPFVGLTASMIFPWIFLFFQSIIMRKKQDGFLAMGISFMLSICLLALSPYLRGSFTYFL